MKQKFKDLIIAKLDSIGQKYTISGDEIKTLCLNPKHNDSHPSYYINMTTGVSHCFSCGFAPHPAYLLGEDEETIEELLYQAKYDRLLETLVPDTEVKVQRDFWLPPKTYDINKSWRGVSKELLSKLGVYYTNTGRYAGRLVFPIYEGSILMGYDARIVSPSVVPEEWRDTKWLRPAGMDATSIVYPMNVLREFRDTSHIIVCEGLLDAVSYIQLGIPAIPSFGLSPPTSDRITKLIAMGVTTITLGFDNDEKGYEGAGKVFKYYKKWFDVKPHWLVSKVRKSGEKDCNDYLTKYGGIII